MGWAFELKSSKIGGGRINGGGRLNERVRYISLSKRKPPTVNNLSSEKPYSAVSSKTVKMGSASKGL